MKKLLFSLIFLGLTSLIRGADKAPEMPDKHKDQIQLIYTKLLLNQTKQEKLTLQYQKDQNDLNLEANGLQIEMQTEINNIYAQTKVDRAKWGITEKGDFTPIPKKKDEKQQEEPKKEEQK